MDGWEASPTGSMSANIRAILAVSRSGLDDSNIRVAGNAASALANMEAWRCSRRVSDLHSGCTVAAQLHFNL